MLFIYSIILFIGCSEYPVDDAKSSCDCYLESVEHEDEKERKRIWNKCESREKLKEKKWAKQNNQ